MKLYYTPGTSSLRRLCGTSPTRCPPNSLRELQMKLRWVTNALACAVAFVCSAMQTNLRNTLGLFLLLALSTPANATRALEGAGTRR
jgi:hypothetical protein